MKNIVIATLIAVSTALTFVAPAKAEYYTYNDYNAGNGIHYYSDNSGNTASSYTTNSGITYYSGSSGQNCSSIQYGRQTAVSCY